MSATMTLRVSPDTEQQTRKAQPAREPGGGYSIPVGYLRAFITLLVVAHHAVLAYYPGAPQPGASFSAGFRLWRAFPVVDAHSSPAFGLFVGFNDTFFMALMFFLSGLFVWTGLERRGAGSFLRHRLVRLGVPFVLSAAVLAPLAYYPAYLQSGGVPGLSGYWHAWVSQPDWPAGPAWFLWVLLAFDAIAAGLYRLFPRWGDILSQFTSTADKRPSAFYGKLIAVSAASYVPLAFLVDPFGWTSFGPFTFQTIRILHYFAYFMAGAAVGAWGVGRGLLSKEGRLAFRWGRWNTLAGLAFTFSVGTFLAAISAKTGQRFWFLAAAMAFPISAATISLAFLSVAVRFARANRLMDSLRDNAYGIYVLHYAFVSWLQYSLLQAPLSGFAKGALVTLAAALLSWGTTAALRRVPAVARVL